MAETTEDGFDEHGEPIDKSQHPIYINIKSLTEKIEVHVHVADGTTAAQAVGDEVVALLNRLIRAQNQVNRENQG